MTPREASPSKNNAVADRRRRVLTPHRSAISSWRAPRLLWPSTSVILLFVVVLLARVWGIGQTFRMLGDQIRDWRIALGPVTSLPLVGPTSSAGGTTLGPVFYWILWVSRVVLGPPFDNLPHAGAIGIAILQSAADVVLAYALARRLRSVALSAAIVLLAAMSPYDLVLSAVIWNPPVAVAFVKLTMAVLLLRPQQPSTFHGTLVVGLAWLGVQAHLTAILFAAPVIAWVVLSAAMQNGIRQGLQTSRAAVEAILLLQLPYIIDHWRHVPPGNSGAIADSLRYSLANPGSLRIRESAQAFASATDFLLFHPWERPWTGLLLVLCVGAVIFRRRDPDLLVVSVAPITVAIAAMSLWQGASFQSYWYTALMPSTALAIMAGIAGLAPKGQRMTAVALLGIVMIAAPWRINAARRIAPFPEYGALVHASREMARRTPVLREIFAPWLPPSTDPTFLYEILGGRISGDAALGASVTPSGAVIYVAMPRGSDGRE